MKNRMLEIKINEEEKEHISIKIQGSFLKLIVSASEYDSYNYF